MEPLSEALQPSLLSLVYGGHNIKIKNYIQNNEGLELKLYKCTSDKWSIGVGRNLEDMGISRNEAELMLVNDIDRCTNEATAIFGIAFYFMDYTIQTVIIDMLFNMGHTRFMTFTNMIKAIKTGNRKQAAVELLDSKYAKKLHGRAGRNAELIRGIR